MTNISIFSTKLGVVNDTVNVTVNVVKHGLVFNILRITVIMTMS